MSCIPGDMLFKLRQGAVERELAGTKRKRPTRGNGGRGVLLSAVCWQVELLLLRALTHPISDTPCGFAVLVYSL